MSNGGSVNAEQLANDAMQDQAFAAWRSMARTVGLYYRELHESGLSQEQAFDIAEDAARMLLMHTLWPDRGPG